MMTDRMTDAPPAHTLFYMRAIADAWRPYRSYATRYVWADYES